MEVRFLVSMKVEQFMDSNYLIAALKSGFTESQIAEGMGVSQSAVRQYIQAHSLEKIAKENSQFKEIDKTLNDTEALIAEKLHRAMKNAILNPMQLGRLLQIVNGTKRRSLAEEQQVINQSNVRLVQLNFRPRQTPEVVRNSRNEVIEVNGRALSTIPSGKVVARIGKSNKEELPNDSQSKTPLNPADYL